MVGTEAFQSVHSYSAPSDQEHVIVYRYIKKSVLVRFAVALSRFEQSVTILGR